MMPVISSLVAAAAVLAAQAAPPPPQAPSADDTAASIARVRAALAHRPALRLDVDLPKPDFVVHVVEKSWFERWIPPPDYRSGPVPPGGLYAYEQQQRLNPNAPVPLFSIPLLPMLRGLAHSFSSSNPGAGHAAVVRAIAEYCAAQPNGGTNIAICMDPTSIR
jgi:hypothetical protein